MHKPLVPIMFLLTTTLAHADITLHARPLTAPDHNQIIAAVVATSPDATHPQGTLLVSTTASVLELDLARNAPVSTQHFGCVVLESHAGMIVGACGDDIVSFDAHANVLWRAHWPAVANARLKRVFVDNGLVIAALDVDASAVLHVATSTGTVVSSVDTGIALFGRAEFDIHAHGAVIAGVVSPSPFMPSSVFTLTPDAQRVAHSVRLRPGDGAYDDRAHIHVTRDRDYTLNDALRVVSSAPLAQSSPPAAERLTADNLGGTGIAEELDVGRVHVWRTFGCCGDQGGLYAAVVPSR